MDSFVTLDGLAQAALVKKREVHPRELVAAAISRIERLNPELNAVVTPLFEQALQAAESVPLDGPFAGVPTLLKDLGPALAGVPRTYGSAFLRNEIPAHDSLLVTRLKAAGMVILGKTNTPELGILPTTEPQLFGPTRNPWSPAHSSGGSSGGSAAAVASGMVPLAHGNDGGGSIRIPAACCGLVGLKPTRGRVSCAPEVDGVGGLVVELGLSRTVRDTAALLDVVGHPDPGDHWRGPLPERPFLQEVGRPAGKLRIGFATSAPTGVSVHPDCQAAVLAAAKLCAALGHEVEEASPTLDIPAFVQAFLTHYMAGFAAQVQMVADALGREPAPEELEPLTWAIIEQAKFVSGTDLLKALTVFQQAQRQMGAFFAQYDLWLTPVLAEPPLPLGSFDPQPENQLYGMMRAADYCPFTPIANATGNPAIALPLAWSETGLPVGVQLVGRWFEEATLLRLAAQLEEAAPWAAKWPALSAMVSAQTNWGKQ
jgi:amidase